MHKPETDLLRRGTEALCGLGRVAGLAESAVGETTYRSILRPTDLHLNDALLRCARKSIPMILFGIGGQVKLTCSKCA
jgi:hypothetical protein